MFHTRLFKTLVVFVVLIALVAGIGYLLTSTAPSADAAAPMCSTSTINTTGLSASEVYYAQRFMPRESCSVQALPELTQIAFRVPVTLPGLSVSEVYYAQRAQRFSAFATPQDIASLPY